MRRLSIIRKNPGLSDLETRFLRGEPLVVDDDCSWDELELFDDLATQEKIWRAHGEPFNKAWTAENPCSRHPLWWRFDAPLEMVKNHWGTYRIRGRKILKGEAEINPHSPPDNKGIPEFFSVHSRHLVIESQAAFLHRHKILTEAEQIHLANHPELLAPEPLHMEE